MCPNVVVKKTQVISVQSVLKPFFFWMKFKYCVCFCNHVKSSLRANSKNVVNKLSMEYILDLSEGFCIYLEGNILCIHKLKVKL